jgi:hypothetical protein
MKEYKFPDPDYEGWEIVIPKEVAKDIVREYLQKTYYWSLAIACLMIGFLTGVLVK